MVSDLDVDVDITDSECRCFEGGPFAGRMAVFYSFGSPDRTSSVREHYNKAEGWKWMQKLNGGMYLCFQPANATDRETGRLPDPVHKTHADGLTAFVRQFPAESVVMNTFGLRTPTDAVDDAIDHYQVRVTNNRLRDVMDGESDVFQWYAREARRGRCDFIIECDVWDDYKRVETFSSRYRTPDDRLWMWPTQDFERIEQAAKSAGVNVALRTDAYRDDE